MSEAPALSAYRLVHTYGERRALDGFDLEVPDGSVFGVLGPNGSGKTTFVSLVAAMQPPQEGTITVFGQAPSRALRARVGTVFQENALDPLMTPAEHLALAGRLFGLDRTTAMGRATSLLEHFGLGGRERERIANLSGGMRRRLEMARALLHAPGLLLLDEPTTGVDAGERAVLWERLRERGSTILLATNDLAEADQVCDLVAFVRNGRVVASGTPASLKHGLRRDSVRIEWAAAPPGGVDEIGAWLGVGTTVVRDTELIVTVDDASSFIPHLFARWPGAIRSIAVEPASLEDAYFQHVGRRRSEGSD